MPQIPLVANMIVVKITHDGIERAPLINGTTTARAVAGLFKTPIGWAKVGLLAARLSNHSVFPKLCKRHLQLCARSDSSSSINDSAAIPLKYGAADGVAQIRGAKPTFA